MIINEEQAGWHPTHEDIADLIHSDRHPSKQLQADMKRFNQQMERDAKF